MKNLRTDTGDSLRPEYKRSDFGEMVRGKYAHTHVEFAELLRLVIACISEDTGLRFVHSSPANHLAGHKVGDWTYEFDNANQITFRYWLGEFSSIDESISNLPCVNTAQERSDLHNLLCDHVQALRTKVEAL